MNAFQTLAELVKFVRSKSDSFKAFEHHWLLKAGAGKGGELGCSVGTGQGSLHSLLGSTYSPRFTPILQNSVGHGGVK